MSGLSSPEFRLVSPLQGSHAVHLPTSYLAFNESKPRETAKPSAKELLEGSFNLNVPGNTWAANVLEAAQYKPQSATARAKRLHEKISNVGKSLKNSFLQ